jgi:hypothetical protein
MIGVSSLYATVQEVESPVPGRDLNPIPLVVGSRMSGCRDDRVGVARVSIQDLGSIGELLAAIATIATLVYLARQIRGSNQVARAEARRGSQSSGSATYLAIAQAPDLAALFVRDLGDYRSLDPVEKTRFQFLLTGVLEGTMMSVGDSEFGLGDDEGLARATRTVNRFLSTPGGRAWFRVNADVVTSAFYRFVLEELGPIEDTSDEVGHQRKPQDDDAQQAAASDPT